MWYGYRGDFPKAARYVLGDKIDDLFVQLLELLFIAGYQGRAEKLPTVRLAVRRVDLLKFFLRVAWDIGALETKRYALLSEKTDELGRMIGGWKKGLEAKTPPK
jgi:hypothetical protein